MAEIFRVYLYPETVETAKKKLKKIKLSEDTKLTVEKTDIGAVVIAEGADEKKMALLKSEVCKVFSESYYSFTTPRLEEVVIKKLTLNKETASAAESCTGGLVQKKLTDISGASAVFKGGVCAYANEMKVEILGVPAEMIEKNGAVSKPVAISLAENVKRIMSTDYGIGITGIAGPGGGTEEKPVGLVCICVSAPSGYWVEALYIGGKNRDGIREEASNIALYMFNHAIDESPVFQGSMVPYENVTPESDENIEPIVLLANEKEELREDMLLNSEEEPLQDEINMGMIIPPSPKDEPPAFADFEEDDDEIEDTEIYEEIETPFEEAEGDTVNLPWYKKLFRYLFPLKVDPVKEKIRKIAFLTAIAVFIGSLSYIGVYFAGRISDDLQTERLQQLVDAPPTQEAIDNLPQGYLTKFANLYSINKDIAGWIKIGDEVDMPVVKGKDNEFYLRKDFYGKFNMRGVPYVDYRNLLSPLSTNTVIYGHNVTPDRIFAVLPNYSKLSFYKENPVIQFDTVYEEALWKVIAVFTVDINSQRNKVFEYHNFINAYTNDDFNLYINRIMARSFIKTTVDVNENDKLLTLSTCGFDFEDQRYVVVARKVRPGESPEVNVHEAYSNPNVLMPDIWYNKYGGVKPDVDEFGGLGNPDTSTPDVSTPDESTPDESTPDSSTPDSSTPTPTPDPDPTPTPNPDSSGTDSSSDESSGSDSSSDNSSGTDSSSGEDSSGGNSSSGDSSSGDSSGTDSSEPPADSSSGGAPGGDSSIAP